MIESDGHIATPAAAFSAHLIRKEPRMNQPWCSIFLAAVVLLAGCVDQPTPVKPSQSHAGPTATSAAGTAVSPAAGSAVTPAEGPTMFVLTTGTVYYSGDPLHGHKADGTFRRGTKVSLVHRVGNYSVVRSEDGVEAYVATHTLEPLAMQ
jgi:hypothetical protein